MSLLATVLGLALAANAAPPLAAARLAPPDATAVIQVRGGLDGRSAGMRTLVSGVRTLVDTMGAGERWADAAAMVRLSPEALLKRCAGRDASLVVRAERGGPTWVLALEMKPADACELLRAVGGRMKGARAFEVPQLGLVGSVAGEWLLVTDRSDSPLLRDMLRVSSEPGQPSFADELPPVEPDGDAAITVALRHDRLAQGCSVWCLSERGDSVTVRMRAAVEGDPLGALRDEVEPSLQLEGLPEETIASWVQPMPVHAVPPALRGACLEAEQIEGSLGPRMAVLVGPPRDADGAVAVAVAYELSDAAAGTRAHDALLDRLAAFVASREGRAPEPRPDRSRRPLESTRVCDEPGFGMAAFGGLEPVGRPDLFGRTVVLPRGGWRVYASDRAWLDRVSVALEEQPAATRVMVGPARWTRVGRLDGALLGQALDRWAVARERRNGCARSLQLLAALLRGAGPVSWRVADHGGGMLEAQFDIEPSIDSPLDGAALADLSSRPLP